MRKRTRNEKEIPIGTFNGAIVCFEKTEGAYAAVVANYTDVNAEVLIEDVDGRSFEPLKVNAHDWIGLTADGDDAFIIKQIEDKKYSVRKAVA